MADGSSVLLSFAKEPSIGGAVSGGPLVNFGFVSDTIGQNPSSQISTTIRGDGQVRDHVRLNIDPKGSVPFNFAYGLIDPFLEGLLSSVWPATVALAGTIAVTAATKKYTTDSTGTGVSFAAIQVGQWVKFGGLVAPANNGYKKVVAVDISVPAAETITTTDTGLVDAAAHAATVKGTSIFNGVTPSSFALEKKFTDLSNTYDGLIGARIAQLVLTNKEAAVISGSLDFMGLKAPLTGAATLGNGSYTAGVTTDEMNANDNIINVYKDSTAYTQPVTEFTLTLARALRRRGKLGLLGGYDIGVGRFTLQAKMSIYFQDRVLLDAARAFSVASFGLQFGDAAGNAYIMDIPSARFEGGDPVTPGVDQDVIGAFTINARIDTAVSGKMVSITRFDGP